MKYAPIGQFLDLGYFTWSRVDAGYRVEDEAFTETREYLGIKRNHVKCPYLLPNNNATGRYNYKPLEIPTMFLEFSDLQPTKERILDFANKYGTLKDQIPQLLVKDTTPHEESSWNPVSVAKENENGVLYPLIPAEPITLWEKEIADMKSAVQLWKYLQERNTEKLKLYIKWQDDKGIIAMLGSEDLIKLYRQTEEVKTGLSFYSFAPETIEIEVFSRFVAGDPLLPAQYLMQKVINEKLSNYQTIPRLLMDEKNQLKQYLMPSSLIASMWFQFYQAVTGEKKYKRCRICQLWEDVTDKKATWTAHPTCSNKERVERYRKKKTAGEC